MHNASLDLGAWLDDRDRRQAPSSGHAHDPDRARHEADQLRQVTALFADVVGSTGFGERLGIEEVKVLIGECITRMCEAVEQCGGTIGSYMGDGIAAFFGVESATEDDSTRAAVAALEIQRVIADFADEVRSAWGIEGLNVRIGINAGRVATGVVGGSNPQTVALGDAVNVAARLQGAAAPGSIVIGARVASGLGGRYLLKPLGPLSVKGRGQPVDAFELLGESLSEAGAVSSFVGRDSELSTFATIFEELSAGRGQIVVVTGEAGIGKTTLLNQVRSRASLPLTWLGARADFTTHRAPYKPLADVLRSWLGLTAQSAEVAVRVRLTAKLQELADNLEELVPPLARLLAVRLPTKTEGRMEGLPVDVLTRSLQDAYCRWILSLTMSGPVVLAIDNLSDVDPATEQLLDQILGLTERAPILVIMTMRPDYRVPGWRLRVRALADYSARTTELQLRPLATSAAEALLQHLDVDGALSETLVTTLVSRAEGNPLYLEELYRTVSGDDVEPTLSPALESLLLSRIERLPAVARTLLQGAAVLGREFSKRILQQMRLVEEIDEPLATLLRADLIREHRRDPAEYTFKHGLLRQAALSTLTAQSERRLHALAAESIVSAFGGDPREQTEDLIRHYFAAGDTERGIELLEGVGERLVSLYRYDEAIEALERCRTHFRQTSDVTALERVSKRSAELRASSGDREGALRVLDEFDLLAPDRTGVPELLVTKARVLIEGGDMASAQELLDQALKSATDVGARVRALTMSAQVALRMQDFDRVRRDLEAIGEVSEVDPVLAFEAASLWAGYLATVGDFELARIWGDRALSEARRAGAIGIELRAQRYAGVLHLLSGNVSKAYVFLSEVYEVFSRLGHTIGALEAGINLVHCALLLGRVPESRDLGEALLAVSPAPFWDALVRANLASVDYELDDLASAERHALAIIEQPRAGPPLQVSVRLLLAQLAGARGDWDSAERLIAEAKELVATMPGLHGLRVTMHAIAADLALDRMDADRALEETSAGLEELSFAEKLTHVPLLRARGVAMSRSGDAAGESTIVDALRLARVMEMPLEAARCLLALAAEGYGDLEALVQEAQEIFERHSSRRGLAELASLKRALAHSSHQ